MILSKRRNISTNKRNILKSASTSKHPICRNVSEGNIMNYSTIQVKGKNDGSICRPHSAKKLSKGEYQKMMKEMFSRFEKYQEKKRKRRNKLKGQIEEEENKELKFVPKVNKTIMNKDNYLMKSSDYVEYINNKIQKLIADKKEQVKNENQILSKRASIEDINKNLASLFEWEVNKKQKLQKKQEIIKDKEMENCTFKPSLNKKSLKIANNIINHNKKYLNNNMSNHKNMIQKIRKALEQREFLKNGNKSVFHEYTPKKYGSNKKTSKAKLSL